MVVTAANSLADSMSEISLAKAGRTLGYNLRTALFTHLQKLSLAFHVRRSTGDVLTRITGDVQALEEFVVDSVSDLVGSVMLLAGTLAYLFWKSWRIALLALDHRAAAGHGVQLLRPPDQGGVEGAARP